MALISFEGSPHGGAQRLLPEWNTQPRITPTAIIDHSIVGTAEGAWLMFRDRSNLESTFIICGGRTGPRDGFIWQAMDTGRQADANLQANGYALSIETEDGGNPDVQPWTRAELESLIWLHRKLRQVHPTIPNRASRSCADPGGHGFHTKMGAPSCWTPVSKSCPGGVRKRQWNDTLLPAYLAGQEVNDLGTFEGFAGDGRTTFRTEVESALREILGVSPTGRMATVQFGQVNNDRAFEILATHLKDIKTVLAGIDELTAQAVLDALPEGGQGSVSPKQLQEALQAVLVKGTETDFTPTVDG